MSAILKIAAYFFGTLFLGALIAPWLFWAGHAASAWAPLEWLRQTPFQRYFDRAMFLAALALLWPTVRALRIRGWNELGLQRDPRGWRHAATGFILAAGLLWMLGLLLWQLRVYAPQERLPASKMGSFLLTAAATGFLEEAFFRGALLGLVRRTASAPVALGFISGLFAILHFLKPPLHAITDEAVRWSSGFAFLPLTFWQFGDPLLLAGGFTTLFAVGWVLGWARLRTRSLWLPFGLHAGWIFGLKSFSARSAHLAHPNLWIGQDLLHGIAPVLVVLTTGAILWAERMKDEG